MRRGTRRRRPACPRCAPGRPASPARSWCSSSQDRAPRARASPPETTGSALAIFFSAWPSSVTPAVSCSGSLENTRCEEAVSSPSRSDIARSTSTITGNAAPAGLGAKVGAEFGAAALGQDGGAVLQQRVGVRQAGPSTIPDRGRSTMVRSPLGIDHDRRDRRHQARHVHDVFGLDALMRELARKCSGSRFRGHRPSAREIEARPPSRTDSDRAIERVAAADFVEMAGVLLGAACRAGPATRNVRSRTGMPMQRIRGGIFGARRRGSSSAVPSCRFRRCAGT